MFSTLYGAKYFVARRSPSELRKPKSFGLAGLRFVALGDRVASGWQTYGRYGRLGRVIMYVHHAECDLDWLSFYVQVVTQSVAENEPERAAAFAIMAVREARERGML